MIPLRSESKYFASPSSPVHLDTSMCDVRSKYCRSSLANRAKKALNFHTSDFHGNVRYWTKISCMGSLPKAKTKIRDFDPVTFLATIGEGRRNLTFSKNQEIFAQGDAADAVFYIQKGNVKLTVVSPTGREAT